MGVGKGVGADQNEIPPPPPLYIDIRYILKFTLLKIIKK